ncbi:hypothetical protein [Persicirhabdus sediminis]|uniref:hypothetical protein n=1 Tax=Persicirhabdus sediminis TaxID=454144 RepID=UPI001F3AAE84|nr:hypothetical protein [Persicirhabdus sediminis]
MSSVRSWLEIVLLKNELAMSRRLCDEPIVDEFTALALCGLVSCHKKRHLDERGGVVMNGCSSWMIS